MINRPLYLTKKWVQTLNLPDGGSVPVRKYEIRTLLKEREVLPVFERPGVGGKKPRRVILPFFQYDPATQYIFGEEGEKTSLDDRMVAVVEAVRESGYDDIPAESILDYPGAYVHFHFYLCGSERHAMGFLPDFDEMEWYFMTRAEIIDETSANPVP